MPPMTEAVVVQVLGPPDSVEFDRNGELGLYAYQVLYYGQRAAGGFPTLGRVALDDDGSVSWVAGSFDKPIDPKLFKEAELRALLEVIDRADMQPVGGLKHWNPTNIIQAVNTLHALGRKQALAVLREYERLTTPQSGWRAYGTSGSLHILLGLLMPISGDLDYSLERRFVECVEDVPLDLFPPMTGFSGSTGFAEEDFHQYERRGIWRTTPLRPPTDPLGILVRFQKQKAELHGAGLGAVLFRQKVMQQLLLLVASVYQPPTPIRLDDPLPEQQIDPRWEAIVREFQTLNVRWDARQNAYVRGPMSNSAK